ncbi:MAG: chitinase [Bacteroidales bacterium]|jgi:chitinase|nr:chitinase [Bacteroidales bacterium]
MKFKKMNLCRFWLRLGGLGLLFSCCSLWAQLPAPALIGYWHNWQSARSGDIPLDNIDARYNVIIIAFAMPADTHMTIQFTPFGMNSKDFVHTMQHLQKQGKRILLSIGGATCRIDITDEAKKEQFVTSLLQILQRYPFDGVDIDVEHGASIVNTGGTITAPANPAQKLLIAAIGEVMQGYRAHYGKKMLLTMAPETAYVQGGQSKFSQIWGAYLPLLNALRDSLDMVQVQLYNSGSMYDINRIERFQGTSEFVVAMTEALIQGMSTKGGFFKGLPACKVAIGLPACRSAAGGGYVDTATLAACLHYLLGRGVQVGNYRLKQASGYPDLGGLMLWSLNWDANRNCDGYYQMAEMFERLYNKEMAQMAEVKAPQATESDTLKQSAVQSQTVTNKNLRSKKPNRAKRKWR